MMRDNNNSLFGKAAIKKDIRQAYKNGATMDNIRPTRVYNTGSISDDGYEYKALTDLFNVNDMSSVIASYNEARAIAF